MTDDLQKVDIEFSEGDVNENMAKIMDAMERLRISQQTNKELTSENKNEYLHLAYRLASCVEALSDKEMVEKMNEVVKQFDNNPIFFGYDFSQDNFWRDFEPEFTKNLDRIVIGLAGDNFSGLRDKHHILNALKYLGSTNETLERRLEVYDTILPVSTLSREKYEHLFLTGLKGNLDFKLETGASDNQKNILVPLEKVSLQLCKSLELLGFNYLETIIDNDLMGVNSLRLNEKVNRNISVLERNVKQPAKKKQSKFVDLLAHITRYSKPLSYLALGALPASIQRRIEKRFDQSNVENAFNPNVASCYQSWIEHLGILGGGIYLYSQEHMISPVMLGAAIAYGVIDGIIKGVMMEHFVAGNEMPEMPVDFGSPKRAVGSTLLKLPLFPLEKILDYTCGKIMKNPAKVGVQLKEKVSCQTIVLDDFEKSNAPRNYQQMLEKLAQYPLSKEIEDNLVWSRENHHTQGDYFADEIVNQMPVGFARKEYLAREAGALTFYDTLTSKPYTKFSGLTCLPGRRFAYTFVSEKQEEAFEELSGILGSDESFDKKLTAMFDLTTSEYLHLTYFRDCKKIEDKTVLR